MDRAIMLSILIINILLISAEQDFWSWKTVSTLDLTKLEPAGVSDVDKKDIFACRWKHTEHGYVVGGWSVHTGSCHAVDAEGNLQVESDKDKIEVMQHPRHHISWQRAFTTTLVKELTPYMIPAGVDSTNGTQQQYVCRMLVKKPGTKTKVVVIGRYLMSKPMICLGGAGWNEKSVVQSSCIEVLMSNLYNELLTGWKQEEKKIII